MKILFFYTSLAYCLLLLHQGAFADSLRVHAILPYLSEQKFLVQDLYLHTDSFYPYVASIACFKFSTPQDSLLIYSKKNCVLNAKKRTQHHGIVIKNAVDSGYIHKQIYEILHKTGSLPAGEYKIWIKVSAHETSKEYYFLYRMDSLLSGQSILRDEIQQTLLGESQVNVLGIQLSTAKNKESEKRIILHEVAYRKVTKKLKAKGFHTTQRKSESLTYWDVYYKNWYIGSYELATSSNNKYEFSQVNLHQDRGFDLPSTSFDNMQSLFSQLKQSNKKKKKQEITGEFGFSSNVSNGQEENSGYENNYYEVYGNMEIPIFNLPVTLQGLYNSQDKNRLVKSSYFRLHYDTEKAKSQLLALVNKYKSSYESAVSRGKGYEGVYQTYLHKLKDEKAKSQASLQAAVGNMSIDVRRLDSVEVKKKIYNSISEKYSQADSSVSQSKTNSRQSVEDSARVVYEKAMSQYRHVQALETRIVKYEKLISQYQNTTYFDSIIAYEKIKDLQYDEQLSYKKLTQKADALLPKGYTKTTIAGLTHIDAGIFNGQASSYTLSGQTVKGLDFGYDFGFCQTAWMIGTVEYAGRDGSLEKYTSYSGRAMFSPVKGHRAAVVYYGYTPNGRMLASDPFFKDLNLSAPSFRSPVHIVSVAYSGDAGKYVRYESEIASSFKQSDKTSSVRQAERMAYNIKVEGNIPRTNITLDVGYERSGKYFENNTAPVNLSGITHYSVGAQGVFFKNFLTVGIQYNLIEQASFASKGGNAKWGFDIKTTSKRYPSVGLSYKPFTTFRSYNDTLDVPQRQLIGEVWTGKANYQIKKPSYSVRFMAVYNKNISVMEMGMNKTDLFQLNTIYMRTQYSLTLSAGHTSYIGNDISAIRQQNSFLSVSGNYMLGRALTITAGIDGGLATFGFSKFGLIGGCIYNFKVMPVTIRLHTRYNSYRLSEHHDWKQLVSGTVDVLWRFKFTMSKK